MVYPEAGHFPELEDPERLKTLLGNEELWNALRSEQTGRAAETDLRATEDMKRDEGSTIGGGGQDRDYPGKQRERKPPDSHL